jgi:antitoxin component YwqK of YwqJK toxin-antitoxin module
MSGNFINDCLEGILKVYDENEQFIRNENYINGILQE